MAVAVPMFASRRLMDTPAGVIRLGVEMMIVVVIVAVAVSKIVPMIVTL